MVSSNCLKNLLLKLKYEKFHQITLKKEWLVYTYNYKIVIFYNKWIESNNYRFNYEIIELPEDEKNKEINKYKNNIYNILDDNVNYIIPFNKENQLSFYDKKNKLNNSNIKNLINFSEIPIKILKTIPIINYDNNTNIIDKNEYIKINIKIL